MAYGTRAEFESIADTLVRFCNKVMKLESEMLDCQSRLVKAERVIDIVSKQSQVEVDDTESITEPVTETINSN